MACTLILIGSDPQHRVQDPSPGPLANFNVLAACPRCEILSNVAVAQDPSAASGFAVTRNAQWAGKPAETYVLQFASGTAAMDWVNASPGQLVGKTILLIDPKP